MAIRKILPTHIDESQFSTLFKRVYDEIVTAYPAAREKLIASLTPFGYKINLQRSITEKQLDEKLAATIRTEYHYAVLADT